MTLESCAQIVNNPPVTSNAQNLGIRGAQAINARAARPARREADADDVPAVVPPVPEALVDDSPPGGVDVVCTSDRPERSANGLEAGARDGRSDVGAGGRVAAVHRLRQWRVVAGRGRRELEEQRAIGLDLAVASDGVLQQKGLVRAEQRRHRRALAVGPARHLREHRGDDLALHHAFLHRCEPGSMARLEAAAARRMCLTSAGLLI